MKTILASAYAINPYKGSEDGMGWNFALQIARFNKLIIITRENNQPAIDKFMAENPNELYNNIQFLYFDLPYHLRFWKKGQRGAMLYYVLWQKGIVKFIESQGIQYDVVHNLNFHNDWTPSYLWKLKKPMVWGPIGHHPGLPKDIVTQLSPIEQKKEDFKNKIKQYFWNSSKSLKKTIANSNHILCMNSTVEKVLNLSNKAHSIMPSVASEDLGFSRNTRINKGLKAISVGRFVPLKGFDLTIKAFAKFFHNLPENEKELSELILVGDGPEKENYLQLCQQLEISEKVTFIPWIDRKELLELYKTADVFLFPSHEGAGMVVSEAMSFGLPVVCLDNCGPGEFIGSEAGIKVKFTNYQETVEGLSLALGFLNSNWLVYNQFSSNARRRFEEKFKWDVRGNELRNIYAQL